MLRRSFTALILVGGLAACSGDFETSYEDPVSAEVSRALNVTSVVVNVPETLTVSEEESFAPDADIVWREDPPGNRYEQVKTIVTAAARRGTSGLRSGRSVRLQIDMLEFHALSNRARTRLNASGVHNITFVAQVLDARSGAVIHGPETIKADLIAYSGSQAQEAVQQGQTQKVRITDHLSKVISGWMGRGPDVRGSFSRRGR